MASPENRLLDADKNYTDEQKRLLNQVEVIQRDVEMRPFGQDFHPRYLGVDKDTGEAIKHADIKAAGDQVLRTATGRIVHPEEYVMLKQGWGRIVEEQSYDKAWKVNANIGIRTRGDDALDIVLVEKKNQDAVKSAVGKFEKAGRFGSVRGDLSWEETEPRSWEYHISRKGKDASNPDNVLVVPVQAAFGYGVLADIGNAGSSYTSKNVTTKNFQPQKVVRNADDIAIDFPPPAGVGVALAILGRDPFDAFAGKKACRGGTVSVPDGKTGHISHGYSSIVATIDGQGDNWGELMYNTGLSATEINEIQSKNALGDHKDPCAFSPIPQDEITVKEARSGKVIERISYPAMDGYSAVPEASTLMLSGNTGAGAQLTLGEHKFKMPPTHYLGDNNYALAWSSPPLWIHGPGNKGTIDLSGLDGRVVVSGGGTLKLTQNPVKNWWYTDVTLTGSGKAEKAVYTIEVPVFDDSKLDLRLRKGKTGRDYKLERYPMNPEENTPNYTYPEDGTDVPKSRTENDTIAIRGDNMEVWVKEGETLRKIYDSEQPELNKQSGIMRENGMKLGAMTLIGMVGSEAVAEAQASRRQFMQASAAAVISGLLGRSEAKAAPERKDISVRESRLKVPDPASASLEELMPGLNLKGQHAVAMARPEAGISRAASRG